MSATIYQFPAGGRAGRPNVTRETSAETKDPHAGTPSEMTAVTACGVAWYHEEAMKEDERSRKD